MRGLDLLHIREDLNSRGKESLIRVARLGKAWGIHGHIIVRPDNPDSEKNWRDQVVWLHGEAWPMAPVEVDKWKAKGDRLLIRLAGINTPEDSKALTGLELWVPRESLPEPEQDEHYVRDLLGMKVIDEVRGELGHIAQVFPAGAADVWVVRSPKGEHMIPAVSDFVLSVDSETRVITVRYEELE
jgi:16S rRNA processing protein RimM